MNLRRRFLDIQSLLMEHDALWRPSPFHITRPPWCAQWPQLATALEALDGDTVERFAADPGAFGAWLSAHAPALADLNAAACVPALPARDLAACDARFADGIPGRKRAQIEAFARHMPACTSPALEWCAGKGHLGRRVALAEGVRVTSLEIDPTLCADAARGAARSRANQHVVCADALDEGSRVHVRDHSVLALHACGELHRRLVRNAEHDGAQAYRIAPCCYHLGTDGAYRALNRDARLMLDPSSLRVAVTEVVTAPRHDRQRLARDQAWKLGFVALRNAVEGEAQRPFRPVPATWYAEGFEAFCRRLAAREEVRLPLDLSWSDWERKGWARRDQVRRFELVRHAFRRPLELWLVLDLALGLEQRGFDVQVGRFCERSLTPRNLLVLADRHGSNEEPAAMHQPRP
ncbi:methyltransferase [Thauera sp. WH-1]|uniref:methyltransferase n=1 Tax=Thauera sp. WH-1 TaxID=3398230 RepID=UPI0039FD52CB